MTKNFIRRLPVLPLAVLTVMLGLAPFFPEPHLWQKLKMLVAGDLVKPIDIFDLFMHATPGLLLIVRLTLGGLSERASQ